MFRTLLPMALLGWIIGSHCTMAQEGKPPPGWLKVEVMSSAIGDKAPAYVGDGDDIFYQSLPFGGGGMSSIIIQNKHTYLAGVVNASEGGRLLTVTCRLKNTSTLPQDLHPLGIGLGGNDNALVAAGSGSYPFAKKPDTWAQLRKTMVWNLNSGDVRTLVYVFEAAKDSPVYQLTYEGAPIADLHPKPPVAPTPKKQ